MSFTDSVFGTPGSQNIVQTPGQRPPGFNFSRNFFNGLGGLMNQPFPTYQGQLDPGMSPTLADSIRRAQGYAQSGPPEILQGVQGMAGQFMSPNFMNPWNSMFGGAPDYGGVNPNQRTYGGATAGSQTFQAPWMQGGQGGGQPGGGYPGGDASMNRQASPYGGGGGAPGFMAGEPTPGGGGGMPGRGGFQIPGQSSDPRFAYRGAPGGAGPYGGYASGAGGAGFAPGEQTPGGGAGMGRMPSGPMRQPGQGMPGMPPSMPGMPPATAGLGVAPPGGISSMTSPGSMGQPGGSPNPFNMGSDQAAGALIRQYGGRGNLLNPLQSQYGQGGNFDQGFMHSSDHESALRQLLGREPTFDEVQKSWRSGSGNIEAARNSFMSEPVPDDRRDGWTADTYALKDAIDKQGLAGGQTAFNQARGSGPMLGTPGAAPGAPPQTNTTPMPSAPDMPVSPTAPGAAPRTFQGRPVVNQGGVDGVMGNGGRFQPMGRSGVRGTGTAGPTDRGVMKPVPTPGRPGRPGGPTDVGVVRPVPKPPPPMELLPGFASAKPGLTAVPFSPPKPRYNAKTGNWHTPGAGENRRMSRAIKSGNVSF